MKKTIIVGLICFLCGISVTVCATYVYTAREIPYTPDDETWNVDNVQEAINELRDDLLLPSSNKCINADYFIGHSWTFDAQSYGQEFKVQIPGKYKIELWGAAGDSNAYGGYTSGTINLTINQSIFFYVGYKNNSHTTSMYNNGTGNQGGYAGGGSTDMRLVNGDWNNITSLRSRIMVAAGGGSGTNPGAAGGLNGYNGNGTAGGTQTTYGGVQSSSYTVSSFGVANGGCTGGNGYYPGGGATCASGAGGGSSFISGHAGCVAVTSESSTSPKSGCANGTTDIECSKHYSGMYFTDTKMIDGKGYEWTTEKQSTSTGMPTFDGTSTMTGNTGNGYVKLTYIGV